MANGGTLYQPQLVRRVETPDGRMLQEFQPEAIRELDLDPDAPPAGGGGAARW